MVFSAKRWDCRNRADLIESTTPCHDALVVGPYWASNLLRPTTDRTLKSESYTIEPQHLQGTFIFVARTEMLVMKAKIETLSNRR